MVEPDDFARFGTLGVIAEVQAYHTIDDMRWMEDRIGDRARTAYAFRSHADGDALFVFGSDWPGTNASWYPAERVSVLEAMNAYTMNAAYAGFEEHRKGCLGQGYLADLVVLSGDPFAVAPQAIKDIEVVATMVGGRWVFGRESLVP